MRLFLLFMSSLSLLVGCSTSGQPPRQLATNFIQRQQVDIITKDKLPAKNPNLVALYIKEKPMTPYRIIGSAKVARHNLIGFSREQKTLHTMMKKLAASIGGDGVINLTESNEGLQATIIQYQKILI